MALNETGANENYGSICAGPCPTPNQRNGLPCGECPVCGSFWMPTWGGTGVAFMRIDGDVYRRWLAENGYGVQPDGRTVPLPGVGQLPNVRVVLPS